MPRTTTLTPEFLEEAVTIRGVTYRLRELSIGDYDELVRKATRSEMNQVTGQNEEETDNTLLLKLMVMKCSVEPKITAETLSGLPMRVVLRLNQTVNRMHYGDEPVDVSAKPGEDESESGNA
jgi:hypothetical protein